MAETTRKIVWAFTREEHRKGKSLIQGDVVCSNINLFDDKAEKACEVLILRGHPKSEACAKYYEKMGAKVRGFTFDSKDKEEPKETKDK